jgi:hypothetical protein
MHRVRLFPMLARLTTLKQTQDPSGARCHDPNPVPLLTLPLEVCVLAVEDQTETGSKGLMRCTHESLGEDIRHLRSRGDVPKPNHAIRDEFSNEVPSEVDVFSTSVRTWVPRESNRALVIAPQGCSVLE